MLPILKNVLRILSIELLMTLLGFAFVLAGSVYLALNFENVVTPILHGFHLLWIFPYVRSLRIVKLSRTESEQFWRRSLNREFLSICVNFMVSFIHCLFVLFLIIMGNRLLITIKPDLQKTFELYLPIYDQYLVIFFGFLVILFFATVALPVSLYGDIKKIHEKWKIALYLVVIIAFEMITVFSLHFMGWLIYVFIPLYHIIGILVSIIIATLLLMHLLRKSN